MDRPSSAPSWTVSATVSPSSRSRPSLNRGSLVAGRWLCRSAARYCTARATRRDTGTASRAACSSSSALAKPVFLSVRVFLTPLPSVLTVPYLRRTGYRDGRRDHRRRSAWLCLVLEDSAQVLPRPDFEFQERVV